MDIEIARHVLTPEVVSHLDTEPFEVICEKLHTMARPRFLAMMNELGKCLPPDEFYLEVGTYQGTSLIGTLLGNKAKAIANDDFSQFPETNSLSLFMQNITDFGVADRVDVRTMHCDRMFEMLKSQNIGLYYFDGSHGEESTLNGLEKAYPFIVENGLIVLDDTFYDCVGWGINSFIAKYPRTIRIVFAVSPYHDFHPTWWNGTIVLQKFSR